MQQLLAYLNFTSDAFFITKRSDFYELREQQKQLKATEMNEVLTDTYEDVYINSKLPAAETSSLKIFSPEISLR